MYIFFALRDGEREEAGKLFFSPIKQTLGGFFSSLMLLRHEFPFTYFSSLLALQKQSAELNTFEYHSAHVPDAIHSFKFRSFSSSAAFQLAPFITFSSFSGENFPRGKQKAPLRSALVSAGFVLIMNSTNRRTSRAAGEPS